MRLHTKQSRLNNAPLRFESLFLPHARTPLTLHDTQLPRHPDLIK
jgi:hypothetical protein